MKKVRTHWSSRHIAALGLAGSIVAGVATQAAQPPPAGPADRPNVLFIVSDDLSTALGGYGHPQCRTPNLDRLAARGVVFERAYCQSPVCGPSRASFMTGRHPAAIGSTGYVDVDFRENLPEIQTVSQYLMAHGYTSARVSKIYHMGVPGEIVSGTARFDDAPSWDHAANIQAREHLTTGTMEHLSPGIEHEGVAFINVVTDGDDSILADGLAATRAIKYMEELPEPFFLAVGMVRPHVPFVAPKEYFDMYPWEEMEIPPLATNQNADVPEAALTQANDAKYGMSREQKKKAIAGYYASVTYMDHQVGRLLDSLEAGGLHENTIVVFTSDHGYNLGEHDCWQKLSLWEETTRVPLIIATPQTAASPAAGSRTREIVELIDLYPTFADLAGLPIPEDLPGESLRPMLENPNSARTANPVAYTVTPVEGESIRTERWRYVEWKGGEGGVELYDHFFDPGEFMNLAAREGYGDIIREMETEMEKARQRAAPMY